MDNFNPPVVGIQPTVVELNGLLNFADLFTVTDPDDNSEVVTYQFRDNGPGGGNFLIGGQVAAANVWHEIPAYELNSIRYRGASFFSRESISVRVFDGAYWSNTATGSITSGNARPVIEAEPGRVGANREVLVKDFITYIDDDGDAAQRDMFVDRKIGPNGGQFVLGDQIMPEAQWFRITASELEELRYQGATQGRFEENIGVMVYDGYSWSELVEFEMATTAPTSIITQPVSVLVNEKRPATDFFTLSDEDGDTALSYNFVDYRPNSDGGYWEYQGQKMPSASWFTVPAAQLDQLFYVGGSTGPQVESVGIQVWDGFEFSRITNVEARTVTPPEISGTDTEVQATHYLNMATGGVANVSGTIPDGTPILDYSDADGDPIEEFLFLERQINQNGGHFVFKGDRLPPGTWFRVQAEDLDQLEYRGGEFGPQSETISVMAFSAGVWSEMASFTIETLPNLFRPELNLVNVQARTGASMLLESLFTWSDQDGDALNSFSLYDTGADASSGYFTVNGVVQPARTWITLDYDQVGNVRYHLSDQASVEQIRMTINDGRYNSVLQTATMEAVGLPEIEATVNDISLDTIERRPVTDIISQTDLGPSLIQYQVYDENDFFRSGRIELDGNDLQQGVVHTLTADEFNRLVFKGAEVDFGRQLDPILIRGDNGITGWTEWERVNVNTDPVGADALTSGTQWLPTGGPKTEVTYSFVDGNLGHPAPFYYVCEPAQNPDDECNTPDDDKPLNQAQRETIREVLGYYETYANLKFVEVPYTQAALDSTMVFGSARLPAGVGAWAYLPSGTVESGMASKPGDVWFSRDAGFEPDTNFDVGLGSAFRFVAAHEIGHAIGFKHPFEGSPVLSIFNDFDYNTVMSYTHDSVHNPLDSYPEQPTTPMLYDVVESQNLYGANMDFNSGNTHYGNYFSGAQPFFSTNDEEHQTTLWDAGGIDTLNYSNHVADETIDLREGTFSTINGQVMSLRIAYDAVIENARGGSGNDNIRGNEIRNLLFGNDGNDVLRGGGGNDVLRGGAGDDTYIWSLGDGRDLVREEGSGGLDSLQVFDPSGQINALEDDFVFRRFGNDLRVDFTLNQGEGQGTVIFNDFATDTSQVELLTIHDGQGQQIGNPIDLLSVFAAADTTRQRFMVTEDEGANGGFIAVPVV